VCGHFFRALGNSLKISEKKNISEMIVFVETVKILEVSGISSKVFRGSIFFPCKFNRDGFRTDVPSLSVRPRMNRCFRQGNTSTE